MYDICTVTQEEMEIDWIIVKQFGELIILEFHLIFYWSRLIMDNNIIIYTKMIVYLLKPAICKLTKIVCYACHEQSVKIENEATNIIKYLKSICEGVHFYLSYEQRVIIWTILFVAF